MSTRAGGSQYRRRDDTDGIVPAGRPGRAFIVEVEVLTVKAGRDVAGLAAALELAVVRLQHTPLDLLAARGVDRVRDVGVELQAVAVVAVAVAVPVAVLQVAALVQAPAAVVAIARPQVVLFLAGRAVGRDVLRLRASR